LSSDEPLRDLFERIDAEVLLQMQERREEEGYNLDFKRMQVSGEPSDADIANLKTAISGFANSAGGIVLWGVDSKSTHTKGDRSRFASCVPVVDGDRAIVRFHELTATATQPAVNGVVHRKVAIEGGFVIKTLVPESDGGPHRTNEERGQYYRRDADAFRAMHHHEIADMFGRRARPHLTANVLDITVYCGHHARRDGERRGYAEVDVRVPIAVGNQGRGLARFPAVQLRLEPAAEWKFNPGSGQNIGKMFLPPRPRLGVKDAPLVFGGGADEVIHPGMSVPLATIECTVVCTSRMNSVRELRIECLLTAQGAEARTSTLTVDSERIMTAVEACDVESGMTAARWAAIHG
jgi:hypothetical protein